VATSYNNLGLAYKDKGDPDRAIAYHNKALELRKALYGEKHPDVATSYNNLGMAYQNKGDLDRAISYLGDALRIWGGLPGYKKHELRLSVWIAGLQASTGRGTEAAWSLCSGMGLLEFLGSDPDRGFWLSQASEILELAERLKTELEDDELYNCRQIIRKYQEELGPVLERLRIMPASFLENDAPSEDIRL
jgi:tetratricopeptide (TPR) repeat protein